MLKGFQGHVLEKGDDVKDSERISLAGWQSDDDSGLAGLGGDCLQGHVASISALGLP